jgi:transaldolase
MSQLDQIKLLGSQISCDSSDFELISKYSTEDATTNPSLIMQAATSEKYSNFIKNIVEQHTNCEIDDLINIANVEFGCEILKHVTGYVSTEVNASVSYDTDEIIKQAKMIIELYKNKNVDTSRILVKIPATWEGICAAGILEREGIKCNLTLIFSLEQAIACGQKNVTVISPFVGRILDWYKVNNVPTVIDMGVRGVIEINQYFKTHHYSTKVMAASFRNKEEIIALAGCDKITISPKLLSELENSHEDVTDYVLLNKLMFKEKQYEEMTYESFTEYLELNNMAKEKLIGGIESFAKDTKTFENLLLSFR